MNTRCHNGPNRGPCNRVRKGISFDPEQDCFLCWNWTHDGAYRKAWGTPEDGPATHVIRKRWWKEPERKAQSQLAPTGHGPGTELAKLLESLGITVSVGCDCKQKAAQMDAWGVEGCKLHRGEIAGWLSDNASQRGWLDKFKAGARAVTSGVAFQLNPADLYGSLVDLAIQRAEAATVAEPG